MAKEIDSVCFWSGYGGGERGAKMQVAYAAEPGGPYTIPEGGEFNYRTSIGGGIREDGSQSPDSTGFYAYPFKAATARYWRVAMVEVTAGHMPRTTSIHFGPIPNAVAPGLVGAISRGQSQLWKINKQVSFVIGSIGLFGSHLIPLVDESGNGKLDAEADSPFAQLFPLAVCFAPVIPVTAT